MIDLTPLEVRQKKGDFRRAMRGYDPELVNDFLDLVADRMEELVKQNLTLVDRLQTVEAEAASYQEKERALSDALMTAQRLREDARSHAEKEGELLIREARLAAEEARKEAARSIVREEEALRQVRARRAQLVQSFRRLLERELTELTVIEEALELGSAEDGTRTGREVEGGPEQEEPAAAVETPPAPAAKKQDDAGSPEPSGRKAARPKSAAPEEAGEAKDSGTADADAQADWLSSLVEE